MNHRKTQIYTFTNIKTINYSLYLLIFVTNSLFYLLIDYLNDFTVLFLLINVFYFILFYWLNRGYSNEISKHNMIIQKLIDAEKEHTQPLIKKQFRYDDSNELYKLFRRLYIRKNIAEKEFSDVKENFGKLIPAKFLNEIGKDIDGNIKVGMSIEKELHIMFIDISGFTQMSEQLSGSKALLLLNIYFDAIVEIVKENGGYVDKFLGDGIMIIFDCKHSDNLLKTSIEIQTLLKKINVGKSIKNVIAGIGINSGKVILGTVGSKNRMDITMIGDTVNVASRLEGLTRKHDDWIIFSQSTYNLLKDKSKFNIDDIGEKTIKGKKTRIHLYGIKEYDHFT